MRIDAAEQAAPLGALLYRELALHGAGEMPRIGLRAGAAIEDTAPAGEACFLIESGLVAQYVSVDPGRATCIGLAGPGEVLGIETLIGPAEDDAAESRPVVPTNLLRIEAGWMRDLMERSATLCHLSLRQTQMQLAGTQRIAACNARHVLPARCAHWLAQLHVRLGDVLPVTHEFLASVLGVRRAGVTVTLQALQASGIIRQRRGAIVVMDVQRLRESACSCPIQPDCAIWAPLRSSLEGFDSLATAVQDAALPG